MMRDHGSYEQYLKEISVYPRIDPNREVELSFIIQHSGDEAAREQAVEELVNSNLRLVVHCLKDFDRRLNGNNAGITRMDLIAEGNIGLMMAARKFDAAHSDDAKPAKSSAVRFSTYACKCIKNRMRRAMKLARFIHIPEHHFGYWSKMDAFYENYGDDASDELLREYLDVSEDVVGLLKQSSVSKTCMLEDLAAKDNECGGWHDFIPDISAICPAEETGRKDLRNFLFDEMKKLPSRTQEMLTIFYFSEQRNVTLKDLARRYGISSERCRQVCAQGIERLRRQMMSRVKLIDPAVAHSLDAFAA